MGSTRRWRRGHMKRSRARDQRLEAGISGVPLEACFCIETRWREHSTPQCDISTVFKTGEWRVAYPSFVFMPPTTDPGFPPFAHFAKGGNPRTSTTNLEKELLT
jgi:hypothetical protein